MSPLTIDLSGDGRRQFVATERIAPKPPLLGAIENTPEGLDRVRAWVFDCFALAVADKRPELERMKRNELLYSGFHWADPRENRENVVVNLCFATTESVVPILTEVRPRPEVVLRRNYPHPASLGAMPNPNASVADDLNDFANWLMDVTGFDETNVLLERDKSKLGWCLPIVSVDPESGLGYAVAGSTWDFYKDPAAEHEDHFDFYFIATAVSTDWLIEQFPKETHPHLWTEDGKPRIVPDGLTSPSYDALKRPYIEAETGMRDTTETVVAAASRFENGLGDNSGVRTNTTWLVQADGAITTNHRTTFLIQMFVRDRSYMKVQYVGDVVEYGDDGGEPLRSPSAKPWTQYEPCCASGWRVLQFTAAGEFIDSQQLDPCFGGRNFEVGRCYPQNGRFYGPGDIDHIAPLNRGINRRRQLLNRALELEALPIVLADTGSLIDADSSSFEPGDVLYKMRGSDIHYLEYRGVATQQFEMLEMERRDVEYVGGVQDSTVGRRPEGIEAAAAIRNLRDASETRLRGREIPAFSMRARLLKRMLVATGRKAKGEIMYRGSDGTIKSLDPAWLLYEYDVRFAEGSGTVSGRQLQEEKMLALKNSGMIDTQTALERSNVKDVGTILTRLAAEQQAMAAMQAQAGPADGGQEA